MLPMWALWLIASGVFFLGEIFTVSFLLFWPGIGAFLAFLTSLMLPDNIFVQVAVFVISSILLIIFTKPLVNRMFKNQDTTSMNNSAILGKKGIVIKRIDDDNPVGQVKVNGELWSAIKSEKAKPINVGESVIIEKIDGVKLLVRKP